MKLGEELDVFIENLDHSGRGVARIDGLPIFIFNALPNEEVKIKITSVKKKYAEGEVLKIYKKSKDRIEPICPYFEECGGCDLLHLNYDNQLKYKKHKVEEIMRKFASVNKEKIKNIIPSDDSFNYRNKITLKVKDNKIGYYKRKTNQLIEIESCFLAHPKLNEIIADIRETLDLKNIEEIILRISETTLETMMILKIKDKIDERKLIRDYTDKISTIVTYMDRKYDLVMGKGHIAELLSKYRYKISPESFFQVNTKGAVKLYDKVVEYADLDETETVLDLFCGTGTIGIYVSEFAKEVIGIEINKYAVLDAYENVSKNEIKNASFLCKSAKDVNNVEKGDVVIVDPPRSGLEKETIKFLLETEPKKIVYVSCNPVTLARDIKLLDKKYDICKITPVDMFPNTEHVECVCLLNLR